MAAQEAHRGGGSRPAVFTTSFARFLACTAAAALLSGCVGAVWAFSIAASTSELLKNECGVTITTVAKGQRPACFAAKPTPNSKRWRP